MARIRQFIRAKVIGMIMAGSDQREVARTLGINQSSVSLILATEYRGRGCTQDRPRSGRPRVTTRRQDIHIRLTHMRNRFLTATETANNTQ